MRIVLTTERLSTVLPPTAATIVCIDRDWAVISEQPQDNLWLHSHPDDLAYVIYTSGSTGIPKGVTVPHRAVVRLVCNTNYIELDGTARVAQVSNASFDALTFEVWGALLHGGRLVGVSRDLMLSPERFRDEIAKRGINVMFLTVSLFNQMARSAPEAFRRMRYLLVGGEALDPQWVKVVLEKGAPEELLNGYGPTENTTFSTYHRIESVAPDAMSIPIGKPIMNTQVYVLDQRLEPVPIGVAGELYLGGAGLAREYLRRPELTAEKFLPHPFSEEPGARLYRTGDQVRWLPDGTIDFLGRIDQQVKLRGFRVELGEIESVLAQHEAVLDAVVLAREDVPGHKRLVAYLITEAGAPEEVGYWSSWLGEKLPEYMVPAVFVLMEQFPLTANGKVDRRALPAPDTGRPAQEQAYLAPRDGMEQVLVEMWQTSLGLEQVGVNDNFFELGGNSIIGALLMNQLQERLGEYVYAVAIFTSPTVAKLSNYLREHHAGAVSRFTRGVPPAIKAVSDWTPLVEIQRGAAEQQPLFFVHPAGGSITCYFELARLLGPEQPFYGLQARGLDGEQVPLTVLPDMASYYVEALRRQQPQGPYMLGGWSMGGVVVYEMAQQLRAQGQEISLLALVDSRYPTQQERQQQAGPRSLLYTFGLDLGLSQDDLKELGNGNVRPDSETQSLQRILELAVANKQLPATIDLAELGNLFSVFKSNSSAVNRYIGEKSPFTLTLFKASEKLPENNHQRKTMLKKLAHQLGIERRNGTFGWNKVAAAVEVHHVPGNHFSLIRQPHVTVLAEKLRASIRKHS